MFRCFVKNASLKRIIVIYHQISRLMYHKNKDKDLVGAGLTTGLGAGVVTSFAISQGQNPLIALGITVFAALFAVVCYQADLI